MVSFCLLIIIEESDFWEQYNCKEKWLLCVKLFQKFTVAGCFTPKSGPLIFTAPFTIQSKPSEDSRSSGGSQPLDFLQQTEGSCGIDGEAESEGGDGWSS